MVSQRELISRRGQSKPTGQGVVCASGCFDPLRPSHLPLLENAHSLGDVLVLAVHSGATARTRSSPGNGLAKRRLAYLIIPSAERAEILAVFSSLSCVVELEGGSPDELFARQLPDVLAIGESGSADQSAHREIAATEALGSKVARVPLESRYSTIRLTEPVLQRRA